MKFPRKGRWEIAVLALLLAWGLAATPAPAGKPDARQEAALFSLADLGPVDLSTRTVSVEVYVAPAPELADCRRMLAQVWEQVEQFYARMGVNLVEVSGQLRPGPLAPAQHLRIELLTDKQWLQKSFKAFKVALPFQLRFLQVCLDKCAFAHLPLSTIHISFRRFQQAEFSTSPKEACWNRCWLGNLLIHELGHLMGLYHAFEFTNDPVALEARLSQAPNFMSHDLASETPLGFVEFQKRMIHSYLSRGQVFEQYRRVNFDALSYLEKIKRYNHFKETPTSRFPKSDRMS
ncbi:MAG TPA: hypothetical protein VE082_00785, partial [Desulfobaccales bacterium]|nr:hypothetical protein [Desulfobaccales bacterium]